MSKEGSCCDVRVATASYATNDGRLFVWAQEYCATCGGGAMTIEEKGLLVSFTSTGFRCKSSAALGGAPLGAPASAPTSPPIPFDTRAPLGSCKPASTHGKLPGTSE
jgi:hypothetical protein